MTPILFARQWGAPILAAILAVSLGFGFWFFVDSQVDARRKAEAESVAFKQQVDAMQSQAVKDAKTLGYVTARLDAENDLAHKRSQAELARATGADTRLKNLEGALYALRTDLNSGAQPCGSGPFVVERLRDARESRERDRLARSE